MIVPNIWKNNQHVPNHQPAGHALWKMFLRFEPPFVDVWLVVLTILKNMKVNWKDYFIYYGK